MKIIAVLFFMGLHSVAVDWDQRYDQVCAVDKMCGHLKASDGTWFRPKPEVMALLRQPDIQNEIKTAAKRLGVNPLAIAGSIAAENSLNVGVKDSVENWLVAKMNVTSIAGKQFTFGLGQISLNTAMDAEIHLAAVEKRAPRTRDQIRDEIQSPLGSIRMAAAILRKSQDDYKAQGIDISNNPAVLATLYNLGRTEDHAADTKRSGKPPQDNYFGLFVEKYSDDISKAAKLNAPPPVVASAPIVAVDAPVASVKKQAVSLVKTKSQILSGSLSDTKVADSVVPQVQNNSKKNLVMQDVVVQSMPLTSAPTTCQTQENGQNIQKDVSSVDFGHSVGVAEKGSAVVEISRGLDCNMDPWKLISVNGQVGWVSEDTLSKSVQKRLSPKQACSSHSGSQCGAAISDKIKKYKIEDKSSTQVYLKPISVADSASFKNEDFQCADRSKPVKTYSSSSGPVKMANGLSEEQLKNFKKNAEETARIANKEMKKMASATDIPVDQLADPGNPYGNIYAKLAAPLWAAKTCLASLKSESIFCQQMDPAALNDMIKTIKDQGGYKEKPTLTEVIALEGKLNSPAQMQGMMFESPTSAYSPTADEMKSLSANDIRKGIDDCLQRVDTFEKSNTNKPQKAPPPVSGQSYAYRYGYNNAYYSIPQGSANSIAALTSLQSIIKTAPDEKIMKYGVNLVTFAKYCHARANLVSTSSEKNSIACTRAADVGVTQAHTVSKEMIAALYKDQPGLLASDIAENMMGTLAGPLSDLQNNSAPTPRAGSFDAKSFCPNRTSEFIEDLIKENPCITHVYIPSNWINKKLSSYGDKVIYRKFDQDDRYMIEYGDSSCKK